MIHLKTVAFQNVTPTDRVENVQNLTVINTIYNVLMVPFKTELKRFDFIVTVITPFCMHTHIKSHEAGYSSPTVM